MGVQDVRPLIPRHLLYPLPQRRYRCQLLNNRLPGEPAGSWTRPEKMQFPDLLLLRSRHVPVARDLDGLPPERGLLAQNSRRAEGIAILDRQRMIEEVQDAQAATAAVLPAAGDLKN